MVAYSQPANSESRVKSAAIYLTGILGLLALFAFAAYTWLPDTAMASNATRIVQSSVTAVAIAAGGIFAGVKLQLFRDFAPHITITQSVTHRQIGDSYVHVFVTVTLHNSSKVKVDFRQGYFRLQQVSPITDAEVQALFDELIGDPEKEGDIQWPTLYGVRRDWGEGELIVEPGESHQEICEFIVTTGVESVLIDTFFYNSRRPSVPMGWGATTVYDIVGNYEMPSAGE